ncbi:hypothetical protein GCM10025777_12430 [Membranihabitans marinus]
MATLRSGTVDFLISRRAVSISSYNSVLEPELQDKENENIMDPKRRYIKKYFEWIQCIFTFISFENKDNYYRQQ